MILLAELSYIDNNVWQYDNPGTADSLIISGTTLTDLPADKSKTGTAFYQTTRAKCFDLPTTDEIWLKFDVYFDGSNRWRAYNTGSAGTCGVCSYSGGSSLGMWQNGNCIQDFSNVCKTNQLQTVLLHMISGASAGVVEAWVDGEKIYTYTGDVNHGQDFADIYLQSDGSGTVFSNVLISNNRDSLPYGVEIKPEIYASGLFAGKTYFKPSIFATYITAPHNEKIYADLSRRISTPESASADLQRKVGQGEKNSANLLRNVTKQEISYGDTERKIAIEEKISGDTLKHIVQSNKISADTRRNIKKIEKIIGDTSRKINVTVITADLRRNVTNHVKCNFDTCRQIGISEKVSADLYLRTANDEIAKADTFRKVNVATKTQADTLLKVSVREKISAKTKRAIVKHVSTSADTFLKIVTAEKVIADLMRGIREYVHADTFRQVKRAEKTFARTMIRIPHILNYRLQNRNRALTKSTKTKLLRDNPTSLVNTFKDYGVTAVNITLNEKTLSDDFRFDIASRSIEINETVLGYLLDYPFHFLVEETNQTDLVQSVKGRYSIDDLLYTWFYLSLDTEKFPKAAEIITRIAQYFLLVPVVKIDDFTPSNFTNNTMMTYADVLSSLFGWTSRVPQRQVNTFIRGNFLYCIQRGKEDSVFDITDLPHSRPTINKKFNRVLCYNPNKSGSDNDNDSDDDNGYKFSGTISYAQDGVAPFQSRIYITYTFDNGLLVKEEYATNTGLFADDDDELKTISNYSTTNYFYTSLLDKDKETVEAVDCISCNYISSKENTTKAVEQIWNNELYNGVKESNETSQSISTSYIYSYNEKTVYLSQEHEQTDREKIIDGEKIREKTWVDTYHVPAGNGWYAQTVYRNGIFQGANLSQGAPGNAISPYTIKQTQENFKGFDIKYTQPENQYPNNKDDELSAIVDDSFPVKESTIKKDTLNEALRWLHRKIIETVTVDLISAVVDGVPSINHIVDFTERVKLNGAEYFLVSNTISFTPRKLIQKLQLIRWY